MSYIETKIGDGIASETRQLMDIIYDGYDDMDISSVIGIQHDQQ